MGDQENIMEGNVQSRISQVKILLSQRKNEDAVKIALENPPIYSKSDHIKDMNAKNVLSTLLACNKGEMQRVIDTISPELEDNLMKYLCKFIGLTTHSAIILDWHQKLAIKAGAGCIMRALTDRKQV